MNVPKEIASVLAGLKKKGFKAHIVGGCVRDLLREEEAKDWDVATSASPEQIRKVFPKSFYENKFLTVTVQTGSEKPSLKEVEITTYRTEARYTDKRHPDEVKIARTIEEDLARRDFTVNAMALDEKMEIIDPFKGQNDLEKKLIRAAGKPQERFSEDALRMMRAVRFAVTLGEGWRIEPETGRAIKKNAESLKFISKERIRDELVKIAMSDQASFGIELLRKLGLLKHIIPELEEGYGIGQNKHHVYEVYEHGLRCLDYAAKKGYNLQVRLAALFHDIGKPRTKRGEGPDSTFYNHEVVGAKMTRQILNRLKFPKKEVEKIVKLVRYHLFYYNVGEVTESSVRRLVRQAGPENMEELLQVRYCDRIGSGCPKAEPYKLRHLKYLIEKVSSDPVSAKTLKVNGEDIMKILGIEPGPKVGWILDILLGDVIQDPARNKKELLEEEIKKAGKLKDSDLREMAGKARKEREKLETKKDEMTKQKYWVS